MTFTAPGNLNEPGLPSVMAHGGGENFNLAVDQGERSGPRKRILAQTNVQFSNSMIESWQRMLKHQWLYINTLATPATVQKLVAFYVEQHSAHLPDAAFLATLDAADREMAKYAKDNRGYTTRNHGLSKSRGFPRPS